MNMEKLEFDMLGSCKKVSFWYKCDWKIVLMYASVMLLLFWSFVDYCVEGRHCGS